MCGRGRQPIGNPYNTYHFPSHLTASSDPGSHSEQKALSATPKLAPRGLGAARQNMTARDMTGFYAILPARVFTTFSRLLANLLYESNRNAGEKAKNLLEKKKSTGDWAAGRDCRFLSLVMVESVLKSLWVVTNETTTRTMLRQVAPYLWNAKMGRPEGYLPRIYWVSIAFFVFIMFFVFKLPSSDPHPHPLTHNIDFLCTVLTRSGFTEFGRCRVFLLHYPR